LDPQVTMTTELNALEEALAAAGLDEEQQLLVRAGAYNAYDLLWNLEEALVAEPGLELLEDAIDLLQVGSVGGRSCSFVLDAYGGVRMAVNALKWGIGHTHILSVCKAAVTFLHQSLGVAPLGCVAMGTINYCSRSGAWPALPSNALLHNLRRPPPRRCSAPGLPTMPTPAWCSTTPTWRACSRW
jgi:hypothetical protein